MRRLTLMGGRIVELLDAGVTLARVSAELGVPLRVVRSEYEAILAAAEAPQVREARRGMNPTGARDRVLDLLLDGCDNVQIARRLGIPSGEVTEHLGEIYRVLGAGNRYDAILALWRRDVAPARRRGRKVAISA